MAPGMLPDMMRIPRRLAALRRRLRRRWATWKRLGVEQRLACAAAVLAIVSTFGPFSWVEAAIVLVALAVLALIERRAQGKRFHLLRRRLRADRRRRLVRGPHLRPAALRAAAGQNALALACAGLLVAAGLRARARRPPDDVATEPLRPR